MAVLLPCVLALCVLFSCKDADAITTPRIIDLDKKDTVAKKLFDTLDITDLMVVELRHNNQTTTYTSATNTMRFLYITDTSGRAYISASGEIKKSVNPPNEPGVDIATILYGIDTLAIGASRQCTSDIPLTPYCKPTWFIRSLDSTFRAFPLRAEDRKFPRNLNSDSTKIRIVRLKLFYDSMNTVKPYRIDTTLQDSTVVIPRQSRDTFFFISVIDTGYVRTITNTVYSVSTSRQDYLRASSYPVLSSMITPQQPKRVTMKLQFEIGDKSALLPVLKGKNSSFTLTAACTLP
ncbi:MAG: hypothetical protein JNL32_04025 [Candidatus Kapabacteria bacterium]|nr:hypothetical protein [Candidatus Kapabacteria bacterium]